MNNPDHSSIVNVDGVVQSVIRTAKWRLMPFIVVLYFIAFMNVLRWGSAVLTINKDVGLTPAVNKGWTRASF